MWRLWLQQEVDGVLWCHAMQDFQIRYDSFLVQLLWWLAFSWPNSCCDDLLQSWLCGCPVDLDHCHGGYNFSFCRWWSWTSCIPVKESTGGGIVDIASPQQLPLGIRRLLYWVCQGGNQLMKPKKHFAHQLSRARMWRLVEDCMLQMFLPTRKLHWWQKWTYLWWYWCVISLFSGEVVKEPLHCSCKLWAHCFIISLPPPN